MLAPWKKSYDKPRQYIKKQGHYFANKGPFSQSYDFFPAVIYGCGSWTRKDAECQRVDAFQLWCCRRLLTVTWTARRSNQFILKESVLNIHWKEWCWSWSSNIWATWCEELTHWKGPRCWERGGQEEKGMTEDEMVIWHHWLNGHEFEQAPGVDDGQGGLVCCGSRDHKESDTTERLNWTDDPAIPSLDIKSEKIIIQKGIHPNVIAALFK